MTTVIDVARTRKLRERGGSAFEMVVDSLRLGPGEFVALLGPSGCGKSTVLDMLGLVLSPDSSGRFQIAGRDVADLPESGRAGIRRTMLGYVLQTGGLLPFLSVHDNIALPCELAGLGDGRDRARRLAEELGIVDQLDKKPAHLSGGQRQRVAIARALVHEPALVLADEPTAAVDVANAAAIARTFGDLTRTRGACVVMATHDENLARSVADRRFIFHTGAGGAGTVVSRLVEAD
jgi:putative ABC transport system ATP-binding protein